MTWMTNVSSPVSDAFTEWAAIKGIAIRYIQSGKPTQNAFIEQYHRKLVPQVFWQSGRYCRCMSRGLDQRMAVQSVRYV